MDADPRLAVTLVTRGSPLAQTGGHLYHQRLAEAAAARDVEFTIVSRSVPRDALRGATGVVVVDSLTAWSVAPWLVGRRRRRPLAAIVHQPPGGVDHGRVRSAVQRRADLALYRRCDAVITASHTLRDGLAADGIEPARLHVAVPGSDLPPASGPPAELRRGRRIAVLCVANWLANKGIVDVLDAVAELPGDRVTLHLAGRDDADPDYAAQVRRRLAEPPLEDRVVVHGALARPQLAALYAGADAFVLASRFEAYGTVFGEALRAGLPTIGTRSSNLVNLIDDGREGCLIDAGDIDALAGVLDRMATDDRWRADLSAAARRRGDRLPTWSDTADVVFGVLAVVSTPESV